jgi:tripartite-type tricarboxylate transporter receptor subunit TctC
MKLIHSFIGAIAAVAAATAVAQVSPDVAKLKPKDFPTQSIEYTVVYPAGGGMDLTARQLGKYANK